MDSKASPQIPLITVIPPKSSEKINRSREKIIERKIAELKERSSILQKIAHKDALDKREVFFHQQNLMHQAFLSFAASLKDFKQIIKISPSRENVDEFISLCSLERGVHFPDMSDYCPFDYSPTPSLVLTKKTRSRITRKRKKKMIQKEKPLESRSWTYGDKRRLRQCGKEMDISLEPEKFYGELYLRFSPTKHGISSVRRQATIQSIKPDIWLRSNLNKSLN